MKKTLDKVPTLLFRYDLTNGYYAALWSQSLLHRVGITWQELHWIYPDGPTLPTKYSPEEIFLPVKGVK